MKFKLLPSLSKAEQELFLKNLNYLNIKEYQGFCDRHRIPYSIFVRTEKGLKKTNDKDRKKVILQRIRHFLSHGEILECTIFPDRIVCKTKLKVFSPTTILHYGQYDKKNPKFIKALQSLTDGEFRSGMIARIVVRDFWTRGIAPTFKQYASAWTRANRANTKRHPEAAYLSDLAEGTADAGWKKLRIEKSKEALAVLDKIRP